MSRIPTVIALFNMNFLTHEEVITWADKQLLNETELFDYISELSLKGPKMCSGLPECEFPPARKFTYIEEFSLRLQKLNENYGLEVDDFVGWIAQAAMGLDIEIREVYLGYQCDHYFLECDDMKFANKFLKEELLTLAPKNKRIAEDIWHEIA